MTTPSQPTARLTGGRGLSDDELIAILRIRRERGLGKGWTGTGDIAAWGRQARAERRAARDGLNRLTVAGSVVRRTTPFGVRWRIHRRFA